MKQILILLTVAWLGTLSFATAQTTKDGLTKEWFGQVLAAAEARDARGFAAHFASNGKWSIAGASPALGPAAIEQASKAFFDDFRSMRHMVHKLWVYPQAAFCEATVTCVRKDGTQIAMPVLTVFRVRDKQITEAVQYLDRQALYATAGK